MFLDNIYKKIILLSVIFYPSSSFATQSGTVKDVILSVTRVIGSLVTVLIIVAIIIFFWGIIMYIIADGPEKKKQANIYITNGIIVLFVMVSVWGLVFILDSFIGGTSTGRSLFLPTGI